MENGKWKMIFQTFRLYCYQTGGGAAVALPPLATSSPCLLHHHLVTSSPSEGLGMIHLLGLGGRDNE